MQMERLEAFFKEQINPTLLRDNGWAEIESFDENSGVLTVRMRGACRSCMAVSDTLNGFMTKTIQKAFPQVKKLEMDDSVDPELEDIAKQILNHTLKL